jgi:hypothetical protein
MCPCRRAVAHGLAGGSTVRAALRLRCGADGRASQRTHSVPLRPMEPRRRDLNETRLDHSRGSEPEKPEFTTDRDDSESMVCQASGRELWEAVARAAA